MSLVCFRFESLGGGVGRGAGGQWLIDVFGCIQRNVQRGVPRGRCGHCRRPGDRAWRLFVDRVAPEKEKADVLLKKQVVLSRMRYLLSFSRFVLLRFNFITFSALATRFFDFVSFFGLTSILFYYYLGFSRNLNFLRPFYISIFIIFNFALPRFLI